MTHRIAGPRPTGQLSRRHRYLVYAVAIGVWLSGALWLLFHYFLMRASALGPMPHPLEPWWLSLHGAFAFAAIWSFGLLWGVHVVNNWPAGARRRSGALMILILGVLIASGYLLYYLGDDQLRSITSVTHWAIGLAAPAGFIAHRFARRARRSKLACGLLSKPGNAGEIAPGLY